MQNIANRCRIDRDHDNFLRRFDIENPTAEAIFSRWLTAEMFTERVSVSYVFANVLVSYVFANVCALVSYVFTNVRVFVSGTFQGPEQNL